MAELLPKILVVAGGLCLSFVLLAFWQSLRGVIAHTGQGARRAGGPSVARAALLREKDSLLASLRELRMEHELGKLADADFQRLEQGYRSRARDVLRALDEQLAPFRGQADALLADARGAARATTPAAAQAKAPAAAAKANEPSGDAAASAQAGPAQRSCPGCTATNDGDAVFCKKCGARLQPEGPA